MHCVARMRNVPMILICCAALASTACDDGDDIFVTTDAENGSPLIVRQGPDFPTETLEIGQPFYAPQPWVLVGDPNGLDDISAVLFNVESITIHEVIIRPDAMDGYCARVLWEPGNIVDTSSAIPVPAGIRGPVDLPMSHDGGGIYRINPFGIPDLAASFAAFGNPSGCATGSGYFGWFFLLPPAAPSPTSVFLTSIDMEFTGVSVTVYDKVGATATTSFPDLRVVYVSEEERATPP